MYAVKEIRMLTAREFPLDEAGVRAFAGRCASSSKATAKKRLYATSPTACRRRGVEYYLPLFFESLATLFDYLPAAPRSPAPRRERSRSRISGAMRARATRWPAATPTGRCSRRRSFS